MNRVDHNGKVPKPTVISYPSFNPKLDCEMLKKAMDGLGTDEDAIIDILGTRTSKQRILIGDTYKSLFGEDLLSALKSELSGDFRKLVELMFFTEAELKAEICYKAINRPGTDEMALVEVICTSTTEEIKELKREYARVKQKYGKPADENTLEKDVHSDCSGYFRRILISLLAAQRPEPTQEQIAKMTTHGVKTYVDRAAAKADAQALYDAGEKRLGTDEETFIKILCNRSPWQIQAISKEYEGLSKRRLIEAIASETSGDFKEALETTLLANISRPMAFAELLNQAISGLGTNDDELRRIIVWRSEIDLADIKNAYLTRYNRDLIQDVKDDTSGDYEKLLIKLLGG